MCLIQSANDPQDPYPTLCTLGIKTPVQCQFSLELASSSNSVSHSNKLYFLLILSHVWKFFSYPCQDHNNFGGPYGDLGRLPHVLTSSFSKEPSVNRQVLWEKLRNSGQGYPLVSSKSFTAHCAPVAAAQMGEGLSFFFSHEE